MNYLLATDCANCDTGSDIDLLVELLELECTYFITIIPENIALVSNVQQNSVQVKQTLQVIHVDNDKLEKDDIVFSIQGFH